VALFPKQGAPRRIVRRPVGVLPAENSVCVEDDVHLVFLAPCHHLVNALEAFFRLEEIPKSAQSPETSHTAIATEGEPTRARTRAGAMKIPEPITVPHHGGRGAESEVAAEIRLGSEGVRRSAQRTAIQKRCNVVNIVTMRSLFPVICVLFTSLAAMAQEEKEQELGWTNVADVSVVVTAGNASTSTFAVDDKLNRKWKSSELGIRFGVLRTRTADNPFAVGTAEDFEVIEDTARELNNERYYVSGQFQRNISPRFFWMTGGGWDRDSNAGIETRSVLFGGVGNTWIDKEQTTFKTDYAITFTRRIDAIRDPKRKERTSEARLASSYRHSLDTRHRIDSDFVVFLNVANPSDYRFDTINTFTSSLSSIFALRFSLQFLYQNLPALEKINLKDFDGLTIGKVIVRKKKLDTVLKFSFVVTL